MKKRTGIIVVSAFIAIVASVTAYVLLFGEKDDEVSWNTVQPISGDIQTLVTATGTVNAVKTVLVGTQVSGVISKIYVDYNDIVKEGQVIAKLDTRSLQVSLNEAAANLSKAKSQLIQVKGEYERDAVLYEKGLVSKSDFDLQLSYSKSAEDNVTIAQNELAKTKINLNFATIVAPISGVIISRNVDVGQTVAASFTTPTLFTIANDLKKMQLQANVDEADISQVKIGQSVYFKVDAYPDESFRGTVQQLRMQPITLNNVVSYAVMIDAPNDDLMLLPGMNSNISIVVKEIVSILKIPISALKFIPPKSYSEEQDSLGIKRERDSLNVTGKSLVFILKEGLLSRIVIETGLSDGIFIEVTKGDLSVQSVLITGVRSNDEADSKSNGLLQGPKKPVNIRQ